MTVRIDWNAANQIMAEIVTLLEEQGVKIPTEFDYDALVSLLFSKDGKSWNTLRQEWVTREENKT